MYLYCSPNLDVDDRWMRENIPRQVIFPVYLNSAFRPSSPGSSSEASRAAEGSTATAVVLPGSTGSSKPGFYLSATLVLLGALSLSLIDLHKGRLRRRKKRALVHTRSIQVIALALSSNHRKHSFVAYAIVWGLGTPKADNSSDKLCECVRTGARGMRSKNPKLMSYVIYPLKRINSS